MAIRLCTFTEEYANELRKTKSTQETYERGMRTLLAAHHPLAMITIAVVCACGAAGCVTPAQQLFSRAEDLLWRRHYMQADSLFSAYIALVPSDGSAWYNRALARTGRDDLRHAMTDLDHAVQLDPGDLDARWLRFRVRELWIDRLRADTSGPALTRPLRVSLITALHVIQIEEMNAFLLHDPANVVARCERAILYRHTGRYRESHTDLDDILRNEPGDVRALTERGNLMHALARYDEALQDYATAMRECDTCRWLLYNSALSLKAVGRLTEAATTLEKLVAADSGDGEAWFLLGECRFTLHDAQAACGSWRRSAALGIEAARERLATACR